jgi:hypothetical protein
MMRVRVAMELFFHSCEAAFAVATAWSISSIVAKPPASAPHPWPG